MKKVLLLALCGVMALPVFAQEGNEEPELTPQEKTALIEQIKQERTSEELDLASEYYQTITVDAALTEFPKVDISIVELLELPQSEFFETMIELIKVPQQLVAVLDAMTLPQMEQFEEFILELPASKLESLADSIVELPQYETAVLLLNFPDDVRDLVIQKITSPDLKSVFILMTGVRARALVQGKKLEDLSALLIENDVDSDVVEAFISKLER